MNNNINALLQLVTKNLELAKAPLLTLLQDGIDRKTVNEKMRSLPIQLPEEIYDLYKWRNGTRSDEKFTFAQGWLFPGACFSSLDDSIDRYRDEGMKDNYWKSSMFPLFESGGGEMFLADCDTKSPTYGMILEYNIGAVDFEVIITIYDSLESLLKTVVECFKEKAYFFDEHGNIKSEFRNEISISRKNNPRSDMWKLYQWI